MAHAHLKELEAETVKASSLLILTLMGGMLVVSSFVIDFPIVAETLFQHQIAAGPDGKTHNPYSDVIALFGAVLLGAPLVYRNQSLSVLSGVLPAEELKRRLADADAAVIMKLGRNFPKVRQVLGELGLHARALYVERATMANQKIVPLDQVDPQSSPYFSLIIVPGEKWQG